ncbi:MAG: BREX-1 system adenine-specific DNA-methyltransferase PglX [Saprospiraceae bacterium]|nr:BREX-1 system adenine-specific DNA-methyltransferase PglX [Saprospiraceae bacterium]
MRKGLATSDNNQFLRFWFEVSQTNSDFYCETRQQSKVSGKKWFPINKGGAFRKWYGNHENVINWFNDGFEIRNFVDEQGKLRSRPQNLDLSFKQALTWTKITSGTFSARFCSGHFLFDDAGAICHSVDKRLLETVLPILSSKIGNYFLQILNSTMNYQIGDVSKVPICQPSDKAYLDRVEGCITLSKVDWDSYETSWDFSTLPVLQTRQPGATLAATYTTLRQQWQAATLEMQRLEEENNRLFITAYGLQDELTPDVPLSEITLTCNPHYRYGGQCAVDSEQLSLFSQQWSVVSDQWAPGEEGREQRLLADTLREFISYAVGCMFGRYSLDKPGLILANQGETLEDYVRQVASGSVHNSQFTIHNSQFPPDQDNAIPMLGGEWFSDDITERFKKFLRITCGEAHYPDNLAFIETALGRDIRSYFLREFYDHHLKTYKKRPIYWLFSSAKGSFNVLIYMHRYRPDTVSVVLNDYLREFRAKLTAQKNHLEGVSVSAATSPRDKTRALKEITDIDKTLKEIKEYEDDILYPLATRRVEIDLDDGVLVNYNKFGKALRKITGLSGE